MSGRKLGPKGFSLPFLLKIEPTKIKIEQTKILPKVLAFVLSKKYIKK